MTEQQKSPFFESLNGVDKAAFDETNLALVALRRRYRGMDVQIMGSKDEEGRLKMDIVTFVQRNSGAELIRSRFMNELSRFDRVREPVASFNPIVGQRAPFKGIRIHDTDDNWYHSVGQPESRTKIDSARDFVGSLWDRARDFRMERPSPKVLLSAGIEVATALALVAGIVRYQATPGTSAAGIDCLATVSGADTRMVGGRIIAMPRLPANCPTPEPSPTALPVAKEPDALEPTPTPVSAATVGPEPEPQPRQEPIAAAQVVATPEPSSALPVAEVRPIVAEAPVIKPQAEQPKVIEVAPPVQVLSPIDQTINQILDQEIVIEQAGQTVWDSLDIRVDQVGGEWEGSIKKADYIKHVLVILAAENGNNLNLVHLGDKINLRQKLQPEQLSKLRQAVEINDPHYAYQFDLR